MEHSAILPRTDYLGPPVTTALLAAVRLRNRTEHSCAPRGWSASPDGPPATPVRDVERAAGSSLRRVWIGHLYQIERIARAELILRVIAANPRNPIQLFEEARQEVHQSDVGLERQLL